MSKKMVEIPEDVARAAVDSPTASAVEALHKAIRGALPPSREERLGLPWAFDWYGSGVTTELSQLNCTNEHQARLIAKAPEMAALLERLCQELLLPVGSTTRLSEAHTLLREAGWLDA